MNITIALLIGLAGVLACDRWKAKQARICIAVIVTVIVVRFFGVVVHGYFITDAAFLIESAVANEWLDLFVDPGTWQRVSTAFQMPLQIVSLGLDHWLFGLEPRGYFLHQLSSLTVATILAWNFLRRIMSAPVALGVVTAWLCSPVAESLALHLMNRHYVEGLILALLSATAFDNHVREKGRIWFGLAWLAWIASMTAKEIFVPLPLLLLVVARYRLGKWPVHVLPAFLIGWAGFVAWRFFILDPANFLVAYGGMEQFEVTRSLKQVSITLGTPLLIAVIIAMLVMIIIWRRHLSLLTVAAVALLVPIIPVSDNIAPRYLSLALLVLYVGLFAAVSADRMKATWIACGLLVVLAVGAMPGSGALHTKLMTQAETNRHVIGRWRQAAGTDWFIVNGAEVTGVRSWKRLLERDLGRQLPAVCMTPCACFSSVSDTPKRDQQCRVVDSGLGVTMTYDDGIRTVSWTSPGERYGDFSISMPVSDDASGTVFVGLLPNSSFPLYLWRDMPITLRLRRGDGFVYRFAVLRVDDVDASGTATWTF